MSTQPATTTGETTQPTPNPFALKPGEWTTMDVHACDICEREGTGLWYTVVLSYAGQWKVADHVCPDCMQRFGFVPKAIVDMDRYERMRDAVEELSLMRARSQAAKGKGE